MASGEVKMTLTIDGMRLVDDMGEIASDLSDLVDMTPDYNAQLHSSEFSEAERR